MTGFMITREPCDRGSRMTISNGYVIPFPCFVLERCQFTMSNSDQTTNLLRLMPIVVGGLVGTLLFVNRLLTPTLLPSQARSDALGIFACAILILTGLIWQQIQPRLPERVDLVGEEQFELAPDLPEAAQTELAWASHLLLTNTVTRAMVVIYDGNVVLRRGILPPSQPITLGAIANRAMEKQAPIYLVALKVYPGRIEFDYLPENTQGVIAQPLGARGIMILGADAPRSYTRQDERWIAAISEKLDHTLSRLPQMSTSS